jgi:hypothetical protein
MISNFHLSHDDHPRRVTVAIVLLVVLTLLSVFRLLSTDATLKYKGKDEVILSEARLKTLKEYLPARGTVGYWRGDSVTNWKTMALIQYSLAPLILSNTTHAQFVIGDFQDTTNPTKPGMQFTVVTERGHDLVLYKSEAP